MAGLPAVETDSITGRPSSIRVVCVALALVQAATGTRTSVRRVSILGIVIVPGTPISVKWSPVETASPITSRLSGSNPQAFFGKLFGFSYLPIIVGVLSDGMCTVDVYRFPSCFE